MGHMYKNEYFHLFLRMKDANQWDISFEGFTKDFEGIWEHVSGPADTFVMDF
jgi:hypothetical protein